MKRSSQKDMRKNFGKKVHLWAFFSHFGQILCCQKTIKQQKPSKNTQIYNLSMTISKMYFRTNTNTKTDCPKY
jgi:hypothetical protein